MNSGELKNLFYEQLAQIGKALASAKRLELIDLLAQGEKSVDTLVAETGIDVRLVSAHLRALRAARLVGWRREGKYVFYRLSGPDVAQLMAAARRTAGEHLLELRLALQRGEEHPRTLAAGNVQELIEMARDGATVLVDVRPSDEFETAHLPNARSLPLPEIEGRWSELPRDRAIVVCGRGPFCRLADEAVARLCARGLPASRILDGVGEWRAAGLALASA